MAETVETQSVQDQGSLGGTQSAETPQEEKPFFVAPETHGGTVFKTAAELTEFMRNKTGRTEDFTRAQDRAAQENRQLKEQLAESQRNLQAYSSYYQQQAATKQAPSITPTDDGLETLGLTVQHVNRINADNEVLKRELAATNQTLKQMQEEQTITKTQADFNTAIAKSKPLMALLNHDKPSKQALGQAFTRAIIAEWQHGKGRQGFSLDEIIKEQSANIAAYEDELKREGVEIATRRAGGAMPSLPGGVGHTPPITDEQLAKADRKIGDDGGPSDRQMLLGKRAIDANRARRI